MLNTFYVVQVKEDRWVTRLVETHEVISCASSLEMVLDSLHKIVKRYKTRYKYMKLLGKREYQWKIKTEDLEKRRKEYAELSEDLYDKTYKVVKNALKEIEVETPSLLKKTDKVKVMKNKKVSEVPLEKKVSASPKKHIGVQKINIIKGITI